MSCFKQNFGLGAIEYLNQVRIRSACDLLRNTDRSISDIAFDTGFHNLSNFNRQFRTKVGCSPQTYRKESVLS
ncbi:helix-turn-helix domain-containing protein [[Ruminococcus] torques]|uniref:helix-turn-helix domain-containing protein n=3 Tax=Clostridia TaxID=186801 RepID=UPI0006DD26B5|nr:helix-turn-helix domain-containing protein [Blautia massiliensis (ex Durand et al. 2017)]NSK82698.1 AraC family transcriptional regulator [Blautia massiliensis (ex Durand et al. 2017)]